MSNVTSSASIGWYAQFILYYIGASAVVASTGGRGTWRERKENWLGERRILAVSPVTASILKPAGGLQALYCSPQLTKTCISRFFKKNYR